MPPPESPGTDRPSTAAALAVGIPAILVLAALPFLQVGDGTSIPKLARFLGRFHPTLLHLPIALLLLALVLELGRLPRLRRLVPDFPATVLDSVVWLAALSGFASAIAGWLLAHEGGYDADLLERHLWSGVATGIGAFACVLLRITATLADNATSRDFVSLLPLTLTLKDYAATERISELPRRLSSEGAPAGSKPSIGAIAYYSPWGNLAIFHRDFEYSRGLIHLGRMDSGIESLCGTAPIRVTFERIEE